MVWGRGCSSTLLEFMLMIPKCYNYFTTQTGFVDICTIPYTCWCSWQGHQLFSACPRSQNCSPDRNTPCLTTDAEPAAVIQSWEHNRKDQWDCWDHKVKSRCCDVLWLLWNVSAPLTEMLKNTHEIKSVSGNTVCLCWNTLVAWCNSADWRLFSPGDPPHTHSTEKHLSWRQKNTNMHL